MRCGLILYEYMRGDGASCLERHQSIRGTKKKINLKKNLDNLIVMFFSSPN